MEKASEVVQAVMPVFMCLQYEDVESEVSHGYWLRLILKQQQHHQ